ncbi:uncharacterized protein LOC117172760 isoform X4 [Belonocnema kinseyi]|uniref:uncharacterized protein LOC117172760 isoform X4 n=1 Tax=Belonocnema kinseyi TaxID=2817044 RepID=UPI00143DDC38|nr:uncharacterized protein LOC117172760 isoform X4 [Belonocnema kinseyi]
MYSKTCASRTCFNTSRTRPDLTFFSFPKSEQFIRAWAEACSSPELENKSPDQLTQLYLCAEHFEDKCFTDPKEKTTLIKWKDIYSIPTIFNHNAPDPAEHNSGLQGTNPMLKLLLKGCTNSRLQKICRLCSCLKPTQCLVPIYGSYYQPLMVKLQPFGIFLSLNDGLPSHICRTCAAKLLLCVETLEQFHESELKLKLAGSTDISTITYDQPGILDKNVINNDRNEANENNISISVPTSSQQEEPEKEHLDSINNFEVEDMAMNDGNNENLVKVEVMDEESNTLDSNEIDIDLPIVKQEVEIEEVSPTNDEYLLPDRQLKNKAKMHSDKSIKIERISSSDELISRTPPELNIAAHNSNDDLLLPSKSKAQYEAAYNAFADWKKKCDKKSSFETILMAYFDELSKKYKPSSLWSIYSMLKRTLNIKEKIDIGAYPLLTAYLKKQSAGFHSKKTHVFSSEDVHKFLTEAPDYEFLATKVALIFGICGACRSNELVSIKLDDVVKQGDLIVVHLPNAESKKPRTFVINQDFTETVRKYEALRPAIVGTKRFFLNYQKGRCTAQVIGIHKLSSMPKQIATFLNLKDPENYTGHAFRRTSAELRSDFGTNISLKRHGSGEWKSNSFAVVYIKESIQNQAKTGNFLPSTESHEKYDCTSPPSKRQKSVSTAETTPRRET